MDCRITCLSIYIGFTVAQITLNIDGTVMTEKTLATCGCREFQLDPLGDHLNTCTHSGDIEIVGYLVKAVPLRT
jgi:hypothetical protein